MYKQKVVESFVESDDFKRVGALISAAHLLYSEATNITDEMNDILEKGGVSVGMLKKHYNSMSKIFDMYNLEFRSMVKNQEEKENFVYDFEHFDKEFRKYAKLNKE